MNTRNIETTFANEKHVASAVVLRAEIITLGGKSTCTLFVNNVEWSGEMRFAGVDELRKQTAESLALRYGGKVAKVMAKQLLPKSVSLAA
jgi:hypothetical protein